MAAMRALVPALEWLKSYERPWLGADIAAGLTTAAIVIPKAMAYATIAGLPLQVGLYTAFVPMAIYAVLGTSRVLSVSTTTTIAILCGAELGEIAQLQPEVSLATATATLTMLVGAILLAARVLRLGFLANFISDPVLTGFKAGIGLVIVVDQVPKLLGIHIDKSGFFRDIVSIADHVPGMSMADVRGGDRDLRRDFRIREIHPARAGAAGRARRRHRGFGAAGAARSRA